MKNRRLPLGYIVQDGEVIVQKEEAEIVLRIFTDYINGSSLKTLVNILNKECVSFNNNLSLWNKGRIYHILMEKRYLGDDRFPQIVEQDVFDRATALKESKSRKRNDISDEIEYIKNIIRCGKCGKPFVRAIEKAGKERWGCSCGCSFRFRPTDERIMRGIMSVMQKINRNPEIMLVEQEKIGYKKTPEIMRLNNEMIRLNEQSVPSFNIGRKLILQIANTKFYNCVEDRNIYTSYVMERIKSASESSRIDTSFIKETISLVKVIGKNEISVVFKNGVEISEKEEAQDERKDCNED